MVSVPKMISQSDFAFVSRDLGHTACSLASVPNRKHWEGGWEKEQKCAVLGKDTESELAHGAGISEL